MENYHLIPAPEGWKLTMENSARTVDVFRTKEDGIQSCLKIITERDHGIGSLKIHRVDGTFEEERTYPRSADPVESPG
jgi:hypothetical protein